MFYSKWSEVAFLCLSSVEHPIRIEPSNAMFVEQVGIDIEKPTNCGTKAADVLTNFLADKL